MTQLERRRLGAGWRRMARMIGRTTLQEIVSPPHGAKPREVLREAENP